MTTRTEREERRATIRRNLLRMKAEVEAIERTIADIEKPYRTRLSVLERSERAIRNEMDKKTEKLHEEGRPKRTLYYQALKIAKRNGVSLDGVVPPSAAEKELFRK